MTRGFPEEDFQLFIALEAAVTSTDKPWAERSLACSQPSILDVSAHCGEASFEKASSVPLFIQRRLGLHGRD